MNIIINGKKIEFIGQDQVGMIELFNQIFKELYEQNEIVQEVIIDGTLYKDRYNEVLLRQASSIKEVIIQSVEGGKIAKEIALDLHDYLPKLIQAFESISELFYGEINNEGWSYVSQMLEGIQWVMESVHILRVQAERLCVDKDILLLKSFQQAAGGLLAQLENDLKHADYTAAGDVIKYELPDVFVPLSDYLTVEVRS